MKKEIGDISPKSRLPNEDSETNAVMFYEAVLQKESLRPVYIQADQPFSDSKPEMSTIP